MVSGYPNPTTAGAAHNVTVTAEDAFGNTATGYRGTVHFTSSDGQAVLPANYTFTAGDAGTHTFTNGVTLKTAGTQSITATDTVTGTITGTQSVTRECRCGDDPGRLGLPQPDHGRGGAQRHGHGRRTPSATRRPATRARSTSPAATAGRSCRATTPSRPGTPGRTPSPTGSRSRRPGTQSITATDTVTGTHHGHPERDRGERRADVPARGLGLPEPDHGRGGAQRHGHGRGRLRQHGQRLQRHGPLHQQRRPGGPAGQLHLHGRGRRGAHLHQRRHAQDGGHPVDHGHRHGDRDHHGHPERDHGECRCDDDPGRLGYPNPTTAGAAHNVTVTAEDAFGNTATGYRGTVHFTSSDGRAVLPANYTFTAGDAGTHTFTNGVTLKTAGHASRSRPPTR